MQADPFFLQDLVFSSSEITKRMNIRVRSSAQLFVLARDQALFKVQFFGGDRAGDLGRIKTKEILYFPEKRLYSSSMSQMTRRILFIYSNLFSSLELMRYESRTGFNEIQAV